MAVPTGRAMASPPGPTTAVAIGLLAATPPSPAKYYLFHSFLKQPKLILETIKILITNQGIGRIASIFI